MKTRSKEDSSMWDSLIAATLLIGHVTVSDEPGIIGFQWHSPSRKITRIYQDSPAHLNGLHVGDKVLKYIEHDSHPNAGSVVSLLVERNHQQFYITVSRIPSAGANRHAVSKEQELEVNKSDTTSDD